MSRVLALCLAAIWLAACAGGPRPPLEAMEDASGAAARGRDDARTLALAGWHAWMVRGDVKEASGLLDRSFVDGDDPWAFFLGAELASRSLDTKREAAMWMGLLRSEPGHLLAPLAAGRLAQLVGSDPDLDHSIETLAQGLLEKRAPAELAARLRGMLRQTAANRGDLEAMSRATADGGLLSAASVAGPFSEWHHLSFSERFAPEEASTVTDVWTGALGTVSSRPFSFPGGGLSLGSEAPEGDVYYALAVAEVPKGQTYVARLGTLPSTGASLFLDGALVVSRRAGDDTRTTAATAVEIPAGNHLLVLKLVRGQGHGEAMVSLAPVDGSPSPIRYRPAKEGDRRGGGVKVVDEPSVRQFTSARALATALEKEAGLVGVYAAALEASDDDRDGSRALIESALSLLPRSAPLLSRQAELFRREPSLPSRLAAARAASLWETVLTGDPDNPQALVAAASLLLESGRTEDAAEKLERAGELAPGSGTIALARARLALDRGFDSHARTLALEASTRGEACRAVRLVWDLARRQDAVAQMEEAAAGLESCRGGQRTVATWKADRGEGDQALEMARRQLEMNPTSVQAAFHLSDRLLASGDPLAAAKVLEEQEAFWPRSGILPRRRAELLERAGDRAGARAAREKALRLAGGDLPLRRMLAHEEGTDVLADVSRDGLALIRNFLKKPGRYDSPAVLLLDLGAVEVRADGSYVEKVHVVARILDKRGIDELGEVDLPHGAEVIHLRTIKPDGRILVPESIAGKDSISLPGLQVGDFIEYEYLVGHSPRGPELSGWSPTPFFFRTVGMPMLESIYVVRAEKEAGLEMDVHGGMEGVQVQEKDGWLTATFRRTDIPALVPEPLSPSGREILPWVRVGAGADEGRIFPYFADSLVPKVQRSLEVGRWARETVAGISDPLAKVRAIYDRAMVEIEGNDRSFRAPASHVLASRRGNRLALVKAALDEVGIEARFAAIRTFDQDPSPYRFPEPNRFSYLALTVRVDRNAPWIWLDPSVRGMPFGELAPLAQGMTAWLLPEPGETRAFRVSTPEGAPDGRGREIEMRLALDGEGTLTGSGSERYLGYDAAVALDAVEQMDEDRRRQVVEASLSRGFRGLILEDLEVVPMQGALELRYRFRVPGFARPVAGDRVAVDLDFFSANLGRRFLARGSRETPLLVTHPERTVARIELALPEGLHLEHGVDAAREHGPFGDYRRSVATGDHTVGIEEVMELHRGRIQPADYPAFARWASAVDRAQAMELVLSR